MSDFDALVGTELLGFRLTDKLGEGGMAAVLRGENVLNQRIVRAIKIVRPELSNRPEFRARFMEEATILENLRHPNVVNFYGVRSQDGWLVMELELLKGHPVSEKVVRGGLPVRAAVEWVLQACSGVAAAHELDIVHRDLKPENLFLTDSGTIKVLDFGIARALDDADRTSKATVAGTVPGSPPYMAPEVCEGNIPSRAADVYALGICLYELLLGHHPFNRPGSAPRNSTQMMFAHVKEPMPPIQEARPDVPDVLLRVLETATAKDPRARFPSARELADALRPVVDLLPEERRRADASQTKFSLPEFRTGSTTGGREIEARPRDGGSDPTRWILLGGVLATLVVGAGIGYVLLRPDESAGPQPDVAAQPLAPAPADAGAEQPRNRWVRVDPPPRRSPREAPLLLGVPSDEAGTAVKGFRPARGIAPPSTAFEIQQHEVTWADLEAWAEEEGISVDFMPEWVPTDPTERANLPVSGVHWQTALQYCRSLGGTLPTEEEWEWSARGPELRPYAWGAQTMDLARTHAYQGAEARPRAVMTSDQDRTPGIHGRVIYDLIGNVQEWTADLWRENTPGSDESWVQQGTMSFRAVRGLPLASDAPARFPLFGTAFREPLCATGDCPPATADIRQYIGFRCVRAARDE